MTNDRSGESDKASTTFGLAPDLEQGKNERSNERVALNLPVRITGVNEQGKRFSEEGYTVDIGQHSATIVLHRKLPAGQNIKIQRIGVDKEALAQVVALSASQRDGPLVQVVLVDSSVNPWDIAFPTAAERERAVLRALLKCVACGRLEVAYLSEFESDVFLSHHNVARMCAGCGNWTTWNRPFGQTPIAPSASVPDSATERPGPQLRSQHSLGPGTQNRRSYERIQVDAVGCIRHPTLGNEIVLVADLGRGGLSFYSPSYYPEGAQVEMAIPYSSKAPNIYSVARIVGTRKGQDKSLTEYRAAYLA